jgi:hypothetical protein
MIRMRLAAVVAALMLLTAFRAAAQDRERPSSFVGSVFTRVLVDPTTYTPALLGYDSTIRDWNSSQPFFQHGFREANERFTISGLPNDVPISYRAGQRIILADALVSLERSVVNNAAEQIIERILVQRFPNHRKLVRTLGWAQRISFASFKSYRLSNRHYRQASQNDRLATQLGYD